jgi:AAA+ superfamily predicted ATPase
MTAAEDAPFADNDELLGLLCRIGNALIENALSASPPTVPAETALASADDPDLLRHRLDRGAAPGSEPAVAQLQAEIEAGWRQLDRQSAASIRAHRFIPWVHLCKIFRLNRIEQVLLIVALLPELDGRYADILATLAHAPKGDGVPSATALRLLGGADQRFAFRRALLTGGTLRQWQILDLPSEGEVIATAGSLRLPAAIAAYFMGQAVPRLQLDAPLEELAARRPLGELPVEQPVKDQLARFIQQCRTAEATPTGYLLHLQGPDLPLAQDLCAAVFAELGMTCAALDCKTIGRPEAATSSRERPALALRLLCRDALLCNRILVLLNCQWLRQDKAEDRLGEVLDILMESQLYLAVLNGPAWALSDLAHRYSGHSVKPVLVTFNTPDAGLRREIWRRHLAGEGLDLPAEALERLVANFPFTETQIHIALKDAASRKLVAAPSVAAETLLFDACREETQRDQMAVAQEVKTGHRLGDLVLPPAHRQRLQEVLNYARHRDQVFETWGFAAKIPSSKTLCLLFHGPSGTGKIMAASAIANELGLSLYKIDLANVLSKYIGETEKQLAQMFDQAEAMNIVLFFDEAESLFSKRTETRDAHDRYANLQTGYLLQRIETYRGIVILSTNLLKNLDPAFTRRFQFIVEFAFPGAEERLQLWRNAFPPASPRADDIDFELLAERAPFSGGNINAAAVAAALYAAADDTPIAMRHVLQAAEHEYAKLGKVFAARDFTWSEEE